MTYKIEKRVDELDPKLTTRVAVSTIDGGCIGDLDTARMLEHRGIAPQLIDDKHKVCSIGFCDKDQKWYGWSHRAICGFGVGSKVEKGDLAYVADTPEGLIDAHAEFFADISEEAAEQRRAECQILPDQTGIRILRAPIVLPVVTPSELDGVLSGELTTTADGVAEVRLCGRGEWTAESLDDAKEMAIDFANSVS